ncbi:fimbria/pilus periplasmic chaperone [Pectobacterium cacticida]|uniref:Fimbria/pilus periplasmic chaperone n=1 Tax=Pectobacterium cacticida TaxID=69221 RepID=A0ABZ2GG94_9GAMM|nr:fimbria/pilus periplasmic chaperone [Pectobacterium cacticida]UYX05707.1 fimbria/pilus periplasmic chaperone [Pectobacterium cacticida]
MKRKITFLIWALFFLPGTACFATSSILVWPIYQVIEADENSSALWLENKGSTSVGLQIRIMSWKQSDFRDRYAEQNNVIATPPFMTLEPGKRNMIRLIRVTPTPANTERAYRIIIDEIASPYQQDTPQMGLQFQMRYLLPLFLDGQGIWTHPRPEKQRANAEPTLPVLTPVNPASLRAYIKTPSPLTSQSISVTVRLIDRSLSLALEPWGKFGKRA